MKRLLKGAAKSKTMIAATIVAVLSVIEVNLHLLENTLSDASMGWVTFAIALLMAALRVVTKQSLEDKGD
jgi:hypothetical protein